MKNFPGVEPKFPSLSFFISTKPVFISFTAFVISLETVLILDLALNPLTQNFSLFSYFAHHFWSHINLVKLNFPAAIFSIKSSDPTMSAPLFFASEILSNSHNTAIFSFFPDPLGS